MWNAFLQWGDLLRNHAPHLFLFFYMFVNVKWLAINRVASRYKPYESATKKRPVHIQPRAGAGYEPLRASFIIPVVDEPLELFRRVLNGVTNRLKVGLDEVIVVINGPRNELLEAVCQEYRGVQFVHRELPGKRGAVMQGVHMSRGNVIVLVDSDTIARKDAVDNLLKPFEDIRIGGVTTFQTIYDRNRGRWWTLGSILRRFADWMEDVRAGPYGSMRATSVLGTVGCLPGRMIAFRRHILLDHEEQFLGRDKKGWFLGFFNPVSDDRDLTNATLKAGYRTILQSTAHVQTDAPMSLRVFWKQQLRWSRGSQYNTLRMIPHMLAHPRLWFLAFVYIADIIVPFWWFGTLANTLWKTLVKPPESYSSGPWWLQITLVSVGMLASAAIRNFPHLWRYPQDALFLPLYIILLSTLLTPIRVIGFFQLAKDAGWGTRAGANEAVKTRNYKRGVPWILGALILGGFCIAGPLLETRELFLKEVNIHQTEIIIVAAAFLPTLMISTWTRRSIRRRLDARAVRSQDLRPQGRHWRG